MVSGAVISREKRGYISRSLTAKQLRFCHEFVKDYNITQAALRAGCGKKSAHVTGNRWLKKTEIRAAIRKIDQDNLDAADISAQEVLRGLAFVAFRDVADFCDEDGIIRVDDLTKLPLRLRRCIDGIKCRQEYDEDGNVIGQTIELKLAPVMSGLEALAKHFGLLVERHEVKDVSKIDWDKYYGEGVEDDPIEGAILKVKEESA